MVAESPLPIICPNCRIALVRSPRGDVEDIVFCPQCRAGGDYKDVLADRANLESDFVSQQQADELLKELEVLRVGSRP